MKISMMPSTDLHVFYHLHQFPHHSPCGIRTYITLAGLAIACIVQKL
jgi:hypothetical protein